MLSAPAHVTEIVHQQIRTVLEQRFGEAKPFQDTDGLNARLGLSSLDLAELVVALEDALGVDPFAAVTPITSIRTVGDLVGAYQRALSTESAAADPVADQLTAAMRRGEQRARGAR